MIPGRYTFRFAKQIEGVEEKKKVLLKKKAEETEAFRLDCIVFRDHRDMEPESTLKTAQPEERHLVKKPVA